MNFGIIRNPDGTKTRYVIDQDRKILREIDISEDGNEGTLYRKDRNAPQNSDHSF